MQELVDLPIDAGLSIGVDIGIGSCGLAVLREETIAGLYVRCFPVPETPDKKILLNATRRQNRLARRQTHRRRRRRNDIARLLARHLKLDLERIKQRDQYDPWEIRARALREPVTALEFAAALMHIAKRRGFRSNSKQLASGNDAEGGKALQGIKAMEEKSARYSTVGEMLFTDPEFSEKKKNSPDDYAHTIARDSLEFEARKLFRVQRDLKCEFASEDAKKAFIDVAFFQRPLQASEHLVGACPFEPEQKRAASFAPGFERFRYLSKINTMSVVRGREEAQSLVERFGEAGMYKASALFGKRKSITYKHLRKALELDEEESFIGVPRNKPEKGSLWEGADVCVSRGCCAGTHAFEKVLKDVVGDVDWAAFLADTAMLDDVAFVISFREEIRTTKDGDPESIERGLHDRAIPEHLIEHFLKGVEDGTFKEFKGAGGISAKAARAISPHMESGRVYSDACEAAGYDHSAQADTNIDDINNPVVRQSLRESLRLFSAVISDIGARPGRVTVEMARDVGKPVDVRNKIRQAYGEREKERSNLREEYSQLVGKAPGDDELIGFQLWKEQAHHCVYSGRLISPPELDLSNRAVEIDHVLPRSRTQDNSYHNKVLCLTSMNQAKRNQSPYEWMTAGGHPDAFDWEEFEVCIESMPGLRGMKKRNLLMRNLAERQEQFVSRNINDTRYASRVFRSTLERMYRDEAEPTGSDGRTRRVFTRPGPITNIVRCSWGLQALKKDFRGKRTGDLHHALDAAIVAALGNDEALTQRLTWIHQKLEGHGLPREIQGIPLPWNNFRDDVAEAMSRIMVSRPERQRGTGEGHEATIRRMKIRKAADGTPVRQVYERKALEKVTEKDLVRIEHPERQKDLIDAVHGWLAQEKKSRPPYPRMPSLKTDELGPEIKKLRLLVTMKAGIVIRGGFAGNGKMVRVDVFQNAKGFWLVPIYTNQVADRKTFPSPPNGACVSGKLLLEWPEMETSGFLFSLYPWSYVKLTNRKGELIEGYYRSMNVATVSVAVSPHFDGSPSAAQDSIGVKTLLEFQKFRIDVLGRKSRIKSEPRLWHGAVCT